MKDESIKKLKDILSPARHVLIIQADNPDTDSLASSLALEQVFGDLGKQVTMYCGVELPSYLKYLPGSDRVVKDLPAKFDVCIIVDTSSILLLEQLKKQGSVGWLAAKPTVIIDHHPTKATIDFADLILSPKAVATGEVIYRLAKTLDWLLSLEAKKFVAIAILSDSLGLTTEDTSATSIHIIAELVEGGVNLAEIENARRETMRREKELIHYKGELLQRVEFYSDDKIALIMIPWSEIEEFSPFYNPSMLVIEDMRLARNTQIVVAFKVYKDSKITAKIRANFGYGLADKLAEHFGGGGHKYASGFKITDGRSYEEVKNDFIKVATELINNHK